MRKTKGKRRKASGQRNESLRARKMSGQKISSSEMSTQSRKNRLWQSLALTPAVLQKTANALVAGALFLALGAAANFTGLTEKIHEEWVETVARAGFQVKKVEIFGLNKLDSSKIYDYTFSQQNRSMAAVDLVELRHKMMQNTWIKDVRVSRIMPETLVVDVVERSPVAVWQNRGTLSLIDRDGSSLEEVTLAEMPDLPLIIGPQANQQFHAFDDLLGMAEALRASIVSANWIGNRRWNLRFDSGEMLLLPEGEYEAQKALAEFAGRNAANHLLGRNILRFDMRTSQFVVRLPPAGHVSESPSSPEFSSSTSAPTLAAHQNSKNALSFAAHTKKERLKYHGTPTH